MTITRIPSAGTLASNTGYDSQNRSEINVSNFAVAVDWLDITFRVVAGREEAHDLINYLEIAIGQDMHFCATHTAFNGILWNGSGRSESGVCAWYSAPSTDDEGWLIPGALKLAFPGSVLTPVITEKILEWLGFIGDDNQVECGRIDIALDDKLKMVKLGKINHARKKGNFFNCSSSQYMSSSNRGEAEAVTIYFGARSSDRRLRIYDKTLESKGKTDCNRWEAQFRRKAADEVFRVWRNTWAASPAAVEPLLARIVLGMVDFRKRSDDDNDRNRCEPLKWFMDFIEAIAADPLRIVVKAVEPTMQKSIRWVKHSVAGSLAMIKISLGSEFMPYIERVIGEGAGKLNNMQRERAYLSNPDNLLY